MTMDPFAGKEPKDAKDVFSAINARQIRALMFHSEMADMMGFLGLDGFQAMHDYQFLSESAEHRKTKNYFLARHKRYLPDEEVDAFDIIPDDWVNYTKADVTPAIRRQYLQKGMEHYYNWESETKELYCAAAHYLLDWGMVSDFNRVNDLVKDVCCELGCVTKLHLDLKAVDYDPAYVMELQKCYCKKYKGKPAVIEAHK